MSVKAYVENIIYYNETNHYAVLGLSEHGNEFTATGYFPGITAGESIEAEGEYVTHPVYGRQFAVSSYSVSMPDDADSIEKYLAGGAIKGIGPVLAKKIVKKFKGDTFRIMDEEPERLTEIKGISERMAMLISEQVQLKRGMREAAIFMQEHGISTGMANRIYDKYGPALYTVIQNNPYQLAEDIDGIGFKLADSIAMKAGIPTDSEYRIKCGISYTLMQALGSGHTWLPESVLLAQASALLGVDRDMISPYLLDMQIDGRLMIIEEQTEYSPQDHNAETQPEHERQIYLSVYYYLEHNTAQMLKSVNIRMEHKKEDVEKKIRTIEELEGIVLDDLQREAVIASVDNGVTIITGGPGTGKTTTINTLIKYYEAEHLEVMLAAPTGRAAKRMTEATGMESKTIHRLLEYTGVPSDNSANPGDVAGAGSVKAYGRSGNAGGAGSTDGQGRFLRNEMDPLEANVLIVDEMSMVDIFLMEALMRAVVPGTRLILVGDADQLPSVGAGNVLKDMISSGCFKTVMLRHIFRQAMQSDIVVNAHKINDGEPVELGKKSNDFLFIRGQRPEQIMAYLKTLITDKLPGYVQADINEIQILTPTRKGALGVENLNRELQLFLNPPSKSKKEVKSGENTFREGDKVMQIKNNYDIEWYKRGEYGLAVERGLGVFNGDMGIIDEIDLMQATVTVKFDDDRYVEYEQKQLTELELSYAVTVHKSQGSEYPAVVIPMYYGPHMLMNKNLLYTAVTRARKCVCLVGLPQVFEEMEQNESESRRYSGLADRLREL